MEQKRLERDIARHKEEHEKSIPKCSFCDDKGRYHEYINIGRIQKELKKGVVLETEQTLCLYNLCYYHKQKFKRLAEEQCKKMVRQELKALIRKQDPEDSNGWIKKINELK